MGGEEERKAGAGTLRVRLLWVRQVWTCTDAAVVMGKSPETFDIGRQRAYHILQARKWPDATRQTPEAN